MEAQAAVYSAVQENDFTHSVSLPGSGVAGHTVVLVLSFCISIVFSLMMY